MSEERKQITEEEAVELRAVIQLSPHPDNTKFHTANKEEKEKEYISLDDVYEVNGNESINIISNNCRTYLANRKLNKKVFPSLNISGFESYPPGYDSYTAVKGGESFIKGVAKGFMAIVKAIKRIALAVLEWVVNRIRTLLGFEKTAKEIAIISEKAETVKAQIKGIIQSIDKSKSFSWEAYGEDKTGSLTDAEIFQVVRDKSKTVIEQLTAYEEVKNDIIKLEDLLRQATQTSQTVNSKFRVAINDLKGKARSNRLGDADIQEFIMTMSGIVGSDLNFNPIRDKLITIMDKVAGVNVEPLFSDENPVSAKAKSIKEKIIGNTKLAINGNDREEVLAKIRNLKSVLASPGFSNFNPDTLNKVKGMVDLDDAEFLNGIHTQFPSGTDVKIGYVDFVNTHRNFNSNIEQGIAMLSALKKSIASFVIYANKVDKLMLSYISRDLKAIFETSNEVLDSETVDILYPIEDGKRVEDSTLLIDYRAELANKYPWSAALIEYRRINAKQFLSQFKIINKIDQELNKLGIKGILQ